MHSITRPLSNRFRTMAARFDSFAPLSAWLTYNRHLTDHSGPSRAMVQHNGLIRRMRSWVDKCAT